uniref:U4/U6 small nuclear ribonucleoprotein Prp31 n=1 Tax=Rhizophora mucronata TaxID=61149 RepID=A0A2P2KA27_RHIMU
MMLMSQIWKRMLMGTWRILKL